MRYRHLLFDADNTILDFARCEKEALLDIAYRFGLPTQTREGESLVSAYRRHNADLWHQLEEGRIGPETVRTERFERLLKDLPAGAAARRAEPERLNAQYIAAISACGYLVPTARSVLKRYAPVIMVTNGFADVQHPRIDKAGIRDLFSHIFISEEVGAAKPQPEFFEAVLNTLGNPDPRTCLVIGDSINSDIRGGNMAGMDTCWFDHSTNGAAPDSNAASETYRIRRLSELYGIPGLQFGDSFS